MKSRAPHVVARDAGVTKGRGVGMDGDMSRSSLGLQNVRIIPGGADDFFVDARSQAASPRLLLYCTGLIHPSESLGLDSL